jgi:hypothetical protein
MTLRLRNRKGSFRSSFSIFLLGRQALICQHWWAFLGVVPTREKIAEQMQLEFPRRVQPLSAALNSLPVSTRKHQALLLLLRLFRRLGLS